MTQLPYFQGRRAFQARFCSAKRLEASRRRLSECRRDACAPSGGLGIPGAGIGIGTGIRTLAQVCVLTL